MTITWAITVVYIALMHFSQHQMDGHMPELNNTREKYMFSEACCIAGNTLNAKKLECTSCSTTVWRFDMKNHFAIALTEEEIPEVAMFPEEEQSLIKKKKVSEKML